MPARAFRASIIPALLLPLAAWAAPVQVINDNMAGGSAAYDSFFVSIDDSDGNLSIDVLGEAAGGNPGARLDVLHFHDPVSDPDGNPGGYQIQSLHVYNAASWDPVGGPISSVSFSLDIASSGPPLDVFFIVQQDGFGNAAGFQPVSFINPGYQTLTASNLGALDFPSIDFAGGGPLSFGFGFISNSFGDGSAEFTGEQFAASFDNFTVTVNTAVVPLPAAGWLLASALAGLGFRRRHA